MQFDSSLGRLALPDRRERKISDDDIEELYRRSLFHPDRFTMRLWERIDYVTCRCSGLRLRLAVIGFVVVLIVGWAIRWLTNAESPLPTPAAPESQSS